MKDILTVMKFTMKEMVKRKSFIVSTIIILLFIVIGFNIPNIIDSFSSNENEKLIIADNDNIFEDKLNILEELNYDIEVSKEDIKTIKEKIINEEVDAALVISKEDNNVKVDYIVDNIYFNDGIPEDLSNTLSNIYEDIQLNKLELSEEQINSLKTNFIYNLSQAEEQAHGNVFVIMLMSIVLFYAIYFCAYQVSSSITTEKTSKIIETLVTSTDPKSIVLGKTLGIGIVGLCQLIIILLTAVISAKIFVDPILIESILDLSTITIGLGLITLLYFILGYFTYALLYALTGSTVSKPEDIQSANSPITLITIGGFYLSYFTMMNPNSNLNQFASLFPISSPFCMPFRIMMGLATTSDIILSIIILVATILIIARVTIKIYSNAILNTGMKLNIKTILKIYKQK